MKAKAFLAGLFLSLAGCASSGPESKLIQDTATAMGGADAINRVESLVLEGVGEAYDLGQNATPDAPLSVVEVTQYQRVIDFSGRRWRETIRMPACVTLNSSPQTRIMAFDAGVAFNVRADGAMVRQPEVEGLARSAALYHHPVAIVQAALDPESRISNLRSIGGESSVGIATADGLEFTLYVDRSTGLPSRVQSMAYDPYLGDVIVETQFGAYERVDSLQMPTVLATKLDRFEVLSVRVSTHANADTGNLEAPDEVKSASVPVPAPTIEVEEVGRGLWYLRGQSHHSIVVEFADHMTLVEAPQDDIRTLAVIAAARRLNPDKPVTDVINTHHHFDHSGGIRAAVSEGLTVITHEANRRFYENLAARSHRLSPDALQRNPQPIRIQTVSEPYVLSDSARRVEIYPIVGNPHADTLLMVYFPAESALAVADVYSTPDPDVSNPRFPHVTNLLENVRSYGLRVDRVLPIHGQGEAFTSVTRAAEVEAIAGAAEPPE